MRNCHGCIVAFGEMVEIDACSRHGKRCDAFYSVSLLHSFPSLHSQSPIRGRRSSLAMSHINDSSSEILRSCVELTCWLTSRPCQIDSQLFPVHSLPLLADLLTTVHSLIKSITSKQFSPSHCYHRENSLEYSLRSHHCPFLCITVAAAYELGQFVQRTSPTARRLGQEPESKNGTCFIAASKWKDVAERT